MNGRLLSVVPSADVNWLLSTEVQSGAALVAIVGIPQSFDAQRRESVIAGPQNLDALAFLVPLAERGQPGHAPDRSQIVRAPKRVRSAYRRVCADRVAEAMSTNAEQIDHSCAHRSARRVVVSGAKARKPGRRLLPHASSAANPKTVPQMR